MDCRYIKILTWLRRLGEQQKKKKSHRGRGMNSTFLLFYSPEPRSQSELACSENKYKYLDQTSLNIVLSFAYRQIVTQVNPSQVFYHIFYRYIEIQLGSEAQKTQQSKRINMTFNYLCLCPLGLTVKLNLNVTIAASIVTYFLQCN